MIGEPEYVREQRKAQLLDRLVDEVVETPKGLKFKNHFDDDFIQGWYVIY